MGTPTWTARCLVNLLPEDGFAAQPSQRSVIADDEGTFRRTVVKTIRARMTLAPEDLTTPNGGCDR